MLMRRIFSDMKQVKDSEEIYDDEEGKKLQKIGNNHQELCKCIMLLGED